MRDAAYHPLFSHAVVVKGMYYLMYGGILLIAYIQTKKFSQTLADFVVVGFCLYDAYSFVDIIVNNSMLSIHWYVSG